MTKVRKSLTSLLLWGMLFYSHLLHAQLSSHMVNPANRAQIASEIEYLYQDQVWISSEQLMNFLEAPTFENYSPTVPTPQAKIVAADDESIHFAWSGASDADEYAIRWIDLKTGETGEKTTTEFEYTIDFLPNATYLFSFQAGYSNFGSADFIIIEDKPIMLYLTSDCQCKETQLVTGPVSFAEDNNDMEGALLMNWPQIYFHHLYRLEVEATNPMEVSSSVFLTVKGNNGAASQIGFVEDCRQNMNFDDSFVFTDFAGTDPSNFMQFSFTSGLQMHLLNPLFGGSVKVFRCTNFFPGPRVRSSEEETAVGGESDTLLKLYPNPSRGWLTVNFSLEQDAMVRFDLINALGQNSHLMEQALLAGSHQQSLDLSAYPSGVYYLNLYSRSDGKERLIDRQVLNLSTND